MDETNRICPWCSTPIPTSASACPQCGALVEGAVAKDIPGVTVVDADATLGPDEGLIPDFIDPKALLTVGHDPEPSSSDAILPPSDAVRLEMRKIELEAEIENAGTEVMNPTGDESIDVGAPSAEALEALASGQLDKTGPAGETDLEELAAPWEDPELESRVAQWRTVADPADPTAGNKN
jgi:hypothetical protein